MVPIHASTAMERSQRRLVFFLSALRCPAFLAATEQRVASSSYRRTLLLWLHALYKRPTLLLATEDQWAQDEPTGEQLTHWLRLVLGANDDRECVELLEADQLTPRALEQLVLVVETVHGRVSVENHGEESVLQDASELISDLAVHQDSVFDDRCEIFPMSIQMMAKELHHGRSHAAISSLFDDDIAALTRQLDAVNVRLVSTRERLQTLQTASSDSTDGGHSDSKALSKELGRYLLECVDLIQRVTAMFKDDLAPWTNPPKANLVGVGPAATSAHESIDHVLGFLENSQSFSTAERDKKQVQATLDVAKDCQDLVDRLSPALRDQLHVLETALSMVAPTE